MQFTAVCKRVSRINGSVQALFTLESARSGHPSNHIAIDVASVTDNPVEGKRYKITIELDEEQ